MRFASEKVLSIWPKWQHCQISQMPIYREVSAAGAVIWAASSEILRPLPGVVQSARLNQRRARLNQRKEIINFTTICIINNLSNPALGNTRQFRDLFLRQGKRLTRMIMVFRSRESKYQFYWNWYFWCSVSACFLLTGSSLRIPCQYTWQGLTNFICCLTWP